MNIRAAIFLLPVFIVLSACNQEPVQETDIIRPVKYITVRPADSEKRRTFSGAAKAAVESRLSFKIDGTVEALKVKVGDRVRKGDLIAELDSNLYELKVQEANAALQEAEAQLRNAEKTYERTAQLYVNKHASKSDLDLAQATAESARAAVMSIRKRLAQAKLQLSYTRLHAPLDGAIAAVPIDINENVSAGMPVALLNAGSEYEVLAAVPEVLISAFNTGERAVVTFSALKDREFEAAVTEVGISAIGAGSTYPVTVKIIGENDRIRPGMAAEVSFFLSSSASEYFIVPSLSVVSEGGQTYVYTLHKNGETHTVKRTKVTTGELTTEGIEITSGLNAGDKVVSAGVSRMKDGLKVTLYGN